MDLQRINTSEIRILKLCKARQKAGKAVYIYFVNNDSGYAVFNAQVIVMMLNKKEPITNHEANVLWVMIKAINERKKIKFSENCLQ